MTPEFKAVEGSSNISAIAHQGAELFVKFHGGTVWRYQDVGPELYKELMEADSKGKFFNARIKGVKHGEKVDLTAPAPSA